MYHAPVRSSSGGGSPEAKRRKIRKGTHSCWECRRRKTRCQFSSVSTTVCIGCEQRGTTCRSQEFADEQPTTSDRGLSQRLSRVEGMLEKLVERIAPDPYTPSGTCEQSLTSSASAGEEPDSSSDIFCASAAEHPPVVSLLDALQDRGSTRTSFVPTPASTEASVVYALPPKHAQTSKMLHAAFPCQRDIDTILKDGSNAYFIATFFNAVDDQSDSSSSIAEIPPVNSHPALLAKRLMQLTNCVQKITPNKTPQNLVSKEPFRTQTSRFVSLVSDLVVSNDDLVGSVEGLETIQLVGLYHANAGNLRKSWLALRRAVAIAQLMGVDKWPDSKPLKSVDPRSSPSSRTKSSFLWYRMNFMDRHLSLLLGLSAATDDDSFAEPERMIHNTPAERFEKMHIVATGAIIRRNANGSRHQLKSGVTGTGVALTAATCEVAFGVTQQIDCDLEHAAKSMGPEWWQPIALPDPDKASPAELVRVHGHVMMQMNHHHLLILLHLPYMMRDPKERRWDYSKTTCLNASRELLRAYLIFRHLTDAASACRHTDYGALTAAMTLLLGYLDPKLRARDSATTLTRTSDRELVLAVRDVMREISERNVDKLAMETSDIITRLLPLTDVDIPPGGGHGSPGMDAPVRLEIPYLGNVTINPVMSRRLQQDNQEQQQYVSDITPMSTAVYNENGDENGERPIAEPDYFPDPASGNSNVYADAGSADNALVDPSLQPQDYSDALGENSSFPFMQFEPDLSTPYQFPELVADADQWTFQGFDATFFDSLFP